MSGPFIMANVCAVIAGGIVGAASHQHWYGLAVYWALMAIYWGQVAASERKDRSA